MSCDSKTFTLSIETTQGVTHQYGYHLGTIERVARAYAVDHWLGRKIAKLPTVTVALMRDGKVFDVWDGSWASAYQFDATE